MMEVSVVTLVAIHHRSSFYTTMVVVPERGRERERETERQRHHKQRQTHTHKKERERERKRERETDRQRENICVFSLNFEILKIV